MSRRTPLLLILGVLAAAALLLWWPEGDSGTRGHVEADSAPTLDEGRQGEARQAPAPAEGLVGQPLEEPPLRTTLDQDGDPPAGEDTPDRREYVLLLLGPDREPLRDVPLAGGWGGRRTDADGRFVLMLPWIETHYDVLVVVPGYVPRRVEIPGDAVGDIEVLLKATAMLELHLAVPEGRHADEYEIRFSLPADVHLERGVLAAGALGALLHPNTAAGHVGDLTSARRWYWAGSTDVQTLSGVPHGHALELKLTWRGTVAETHDLPPLHAGERRVVYLQPAAPMLTRVTAVTASGSLIRGAQLVIHSMNMELGEVSLPYRVSPESDGGWLIPQTLGPGVMLEFSARGSVTRHFRRMPPAQVVLQPSTTLTVRLSLADGSEVPAGLAVSVWWMDQDRKHRASRIPLTPADAPVFGGLPHGLVTVTVGGAEVESEEVLHDTRSGELRMVLRPRE